MLPRNDSTKQSSSKTSSTRRIAALVLCVSFGVATSPAVAQAQVANSISLQPYTAPDQSASAGVPAGWKVTQSGQTVIVMEGPEGERIFLGKGFTARNGVFQRGQHPGGGIDLTMPFNASLGQKFLMLITASSGGAQGQTPLRIVSATPIQVPAILGQCGHFIADNSDANGATKIEAVLCSLPMDSAGVYKNFFKMASAPAAVAAQTHPTARAVFASYRVPEQWLERKLAPTTQAPMPIPAQGGGLRPAGGISPNPSAVSTAAKCYDLAVIRETPQAQLPAECGGPRAQ